MTRMFTKAILLCVTFGMFCASCPAQQSWLILGADGNWKTFTKQSEFLKVAKATQPQETAVVTRAEKSVSVVYDVIAESGDWRNIDRYQFRLDGNLITLERTFLSASDDMKLTQTYEPDASGKPQKKLERKVSASTGRTTTKTPEFIPELPIAANMNQLEFMKAH